MIKSLLDIDYYKFTMGQFVWLKHKDITVQYKMIDRKNNCLGNLSIDEFFEHIEEVRNLQFSNKELDYLYKLGFRADYVAWLSNFQLPEIQRVEDLNDLTVEGLWYETIYWETILMSIVSEMQGRQYDYLQNAAERYLREKINSIKELGRHYNFTFADFGTRRRHSYNWQHEVIATLFNEADIPFIGTSNVCLSRFTGRKPVGTNAHELQMVLAAPYLPNPERLAEAIEQVYFGWEEVYTEDYTLLTDTFGTKLFLDTYYRKNGSFYMDGPVTFRQDSGSPIAYTEYVFSFPFTKNVKTIIYSDGLDVNKMLPILTHNKGKRINTVFGWGTNLTNDFVVNEAPSVVVKPVKMGYNGILSYDVIKLSDNLRKATGNPELIRQLVDRMSLYKEL